MIRLRRTGPARVGATPDYAAFLESKRVVVPNRGRQVAPESLHLRLFDWQRDMIRWALRKGRAALFADCGLGKTIMQVEWARCTGQKALILAPLAVAQQTVREAAKFDTEVVYARRQADATGPLTVTNYEMLDKFDPAAFGAVVLDESSILKSFEGKTRTRLIAAFRETPYRLCCTATPAPNDVAEIANHAEFLGILSRVEMLATFFVHDDDGWRLKGHAQEAFYRWLASWAMWLRRPSDLGYADDGFVLPPLTIEPVIVPSAYVPEGQLFFTGLKGITDRAKVRRGTALDRVTKTAQLVNRDKGNQWLVWCGLNDEGRALHRLIEGATLIEGSMTLAEKEGGIKAFLDGDARVLISKPSICGHGLNLQNCARMAFVGLSDSFEAYYQALRRCWRFGQGRPVEAYVVLSDAEESIYANVLRKEEEAKRMANEIIANVGEFERAEIGQAAVGAFVYREDEAEGDGWTLKLGDSVERLSEVADSSVGLSVYSPPFQSLYTYSATERDLGNSPRPTDFWRHYGFIMRELLRVTIPGRDTCCHVAQLATHLVTDGVIGVQDFRGDVIRAYQAEGWIYHGEVCIDKDPQAVAIRTHAKGLLFAQLRRDAAWMRPGLADYILVFRKPGENPEPVRPDVTNDEWVEWARPIWYGIRESDTLNVAEARSEKDERHICPLQLETIRRCIRLWSNKDDLVLSPFAGIGSEGYVALEQGRRFVGIELKSEYWQVAVTNLRRAEHRAKSGSLFAAVGVEMD